MIQRDTQALQPILRDLAYADEIRLLNEFDGRFAEYRTLDRTILGLAVENTNLKAQRLSFGPAREAADAFRDSLEAIARASQDAWRVHAMVASAVANVREIQVLQAPHIAESDEAEMSRMETQMAAAETAARRALDSLKGLVRPSPDLGGRRGGPGPIQGHQRRTRRAVAPQQRRPLPGAVAGTQAHADRGVR